MYPVCFARCHELFSIKAEPHRGTGRLIRSDSQIAIPDLPGGCYVPPVSEACWQKLRGLALAEVEGTLAALPEALRRKAENLPVTFERWPNRGLQSDGIAPDTLGLFVGPDYADEEVTACPMPPQIILFLQNLWDAAEGDEGVFREEVHTTLLHELGHYLGLDEGDLAERGLD